MIATTHAAKSYEEKLQEENRQSKTMLNLAWNLEDLEQLNTLARGLRVEVGSVLDVMKDVTTDPRELNVPQRLEGLRNKLCTLAKGVSRYRREAATHIFVFMISPESRAFKPYAVPVQCVPYVGMKEKKLRELIRAIIRAMVERGMKVAGEFVCQLKNMEKDKVFMLACIVHRWTCS